MDELEEEVVGGEEREQVLVLWCSLSLPSRATILHRPPPGQTSNILYAFTDSLVVLFLFRVLFFSLLKCDSITFFTLPPLHFTLDQ